MIERSTPVARAVVRFRFVPLVLIALLGLKIFLSVVLHQGALAEACGSACYFLFILLATGFACVNAAQGRGTEGFFWIFIAAGAALWALDQGIYLYYEFILHAGIPDNSIADPALFLHIVPFMAAVALVPHLSSARLKLYRPTLNFLLVLFFWVFLYTYLVFPYQYLFPDTAIYKQRFDALYLIENLVLVVSVGAFGIRSKGPWRSVYLHLFGASTLYMLSSTIPNIAIDAGLYSNRAVFASGLDAAAAWFVWSTLSWRDIAEGNVASVFSEPETRASGPFWAMLILVAIPVFGIWDLLRRDEAHGIRDFRLVVVLAAVILLAFAALLKDYFAERELKADVRVSKLESTLSQVALGASEASRKEVETHYQELTETVPAIMWRADPKTFQVRFVNTQAKEILG